MAREHDAHMTALYVAQCARNTVWTTDCAKTAAAVDTTSGGVGSRHAAGSAPRGEESQQYVASSSPAGVAPGPLTHNAPADAAPSGRARADAAGVPLERAVLKAVLAALRAHPRVAFVERMNSGAYKSAAGHYVRYGFVGCPDIIGMLKDGRFLAVEVKRPGGNPTGDQVEFLGVVARWHGVAFVAWSADDVARALA